MNMKSVLLVCLVFAVAFSSAKLVGGLSEEKPVDANVISIANEVREQAQAKLPNESFQSYTPISYSTQTVAGVNYFIRVDIGAEYHIVLRVFKSLRGELSLHSTKSNVGKNDALPYF